MENTDVRDETEKRGWLRKLVGDTRQRRSEAPVVQQPETPEPPQVPPDLPPELPPQPEEPIPAPGPDVIPPPATPGPEMPVPADPGPEMPSPGDPEPEMPGPPPDVIPPPGVPGGPEMPPPSPPEPEMPGTPWPQPDLPEGPGPEIVPPAPGLEVPGIQAHSAVRSESAGGAASPGGRSAAEAEWIARRSQELRARAEAATEADEGWLSRLRRGLGRSSAKLSAGIGDLFVKRRLDDAALEDLEELLITGDLGVQTSARLTQALAEARFGQDISAVEVREALASEVAKVLEPVAQTIAINDSYRPHVILVCGVNGSGKTTTIAKLARLFQSVGFTTVLAAGDTFRAAAIEQLQIWGKRTGCTVVARPPGSDPASLAFEAYEQARQHGAQVLLIDTAGRLHNKAGLMAELQKICRVLKKVDERAPHDCLLVLDASVGQNAHNQVEVFREMVNVTGLVITKLDGSAKGGVVVALADRFALPVYAIGVGEGMDDMRAFEARAYARSLLDLPA